MKNSQLTEIRARVDALDEGEWTVDRNYPFSSDFVGIFNKTTQEYVIKSLEDEQPSDEVATFLANSRADVLALLEHIAVLTA